MMNVMIILAGIGGTLIITERLYNSIRVFIRYCREGSYQKRIDRKLNSLRYVKYERRA